MEQGRQREAVQVQHPSVFAFGLPVSRAARRTPEGAQGADWLSSFASHWLGPGSDAASRPALGRVHRSTLGRGKKCRAQRVGDRPCEFCTPPRLDQPIPFPGQHAERRKEHRGADWLSTLSSYWLGPGSGRQCWRVCPSELCVGTGGLGGWRRTAWAVVAQLVAVESWALVISSCTHCPPFPSILFLSDALQSSGGRDDIIRITNGPSNSFLTLQKKEGYELPSFLYMRKQTRSLISSWLLMTFKAPRSQISTTRNVNTSSSLPCELAQRLSTLASESSGALVKTSPPTHSTSDSVNQDEAPNFAFLSRFQVMWILPIRDHALQTFTCRNRASL